MEFPTTLDTLDVIPENVRVFYAQDPETKKWILSDSPAVQAAVSVIAGQAGVLKKVRGENELLSKGKIDLSPLKDYGDDPLAIAEGIKAAVTAAQGDKASDIEKTAKRIREEMGKGHEAELEKKGIRATALEKQLFALMGTGEAKRALGEVGAADVDLALPFVLERLRTVEEHGEMDVRVMDAEGEIKYGTTGRPMTVKELCVEMKGTPKFGLLFKSETPQGGGPTPGAPSGKAPPKGEAPKSATEKIAAGLRAGQHQGARAEGAANARHQG